MIYMHVCKHTESNAQKHTQNDQDSIFLISDPGLWDKVVDLMHAMYVHAVVAIFNAIIFSFSTTKSSTEM